MITNKMISHQEFRKEQFKMYCLVPLLFPGYSEFLVRQLVGLKLYKEKNLFSYADRLQVFMSASLIDVPGKDRQATLEDYVSLSLSGLSYWVSKAVTMATDCYPEVAKEILRKDIDAVEELHNYFELFLPDLRISLKQALAKAPNYALNKP